MRFLLWYLWIAPHVLLVFALAILLRRGRQNQLPFFVAYVAFQLFDFVTLVTADLVVVLHPGYRLDVYRWILVGNVGINSLLSFGVIYELVSCLILARSTLANALRPVMRWSAAMLLLLTVIAASRLGVNIEHVTNVFQVLDFSSNVLQVGLLAVLFLFSRVLRISWGSLAVGIAVGLGMLGCVELAAAPLFSALGSHRYAAIDAVRLAGFHLCVLVWLGYLVFPERRPKFAGQPPEISDLESWDQELQRMVRR